MRIYSGLAVILGLLLTQKVMSLNDDDLSGDDDDDDILKCEERTNKEARCNQACHSDDDCTADKEECICDGDCGLCCVNPDTSCSSAPSVRYAKKTVTSRKFQGVVTYKCDSPRKLFGSENKTCRGTGEWDGSNTKCLIFCGDPGRRSNSRSEVANSRSKKKFTQGSKIKYWCFPGYTLKGEETLTCRSNGRWSSKPPSCKAGECEDPVLPDNSELLSRKKKKYGLGDRIFMKCKNGYSFGGSPRRECLGEKWSPNYLICKAKSCGDPGVPLNGQRLGLVFTFKSRVNFKCNTGYQVKGARYRICQSNQRWSGSQPTCEIIDCGNPLVPTNGKVVGSIVSTTFGSKVSFECDPGFVLHGARERTCGDDSWWTGETTECREVSCPDVIIPHGRVDPTGSIRVGTGVKFICDKDHVLSGNSESRCIMGSDPGSGSWTKKAPSCKKPCVVPALPQEAYTQGDYKHGETTRFYCNGDYEFVGTSSVKCQDGKWDRQPNVQCMGPCLIPVLPNKAKRYGGNKHGETMRFYCEGKFVFEGTNKLTCSNGAWDKVPQLSCKRPCHIPDTTANMLKTGSNKHGDKMVFSCKTNYVFEGTKQLVCTDGDWDKVPDLKCTALCPDPRIPLNGRVIGTNYKDGSSIQFECDLDYQLSGENQITCNGGEWSFSEPRCLATCSPPELDPNVVIINKKRSYTEDKIIQFQCISDEFTLDGQETSTCMNKIWSNSPPQCLGGCKKPVKPEHSKMTGSEFHHGATVTFKCEEPFILEGSPVMTCHNGSWGGKPPVCKECSMPLGMKNKKIKDSQITGKGTALGTRHSNARLDGTSDWCAQLGRHYNKDIYIQVDLGAKYDVNAITVQAGLAQESVMRRFFIRHKKEKNDDLKTYEEGGQAKELSAGEIKLKESFIARYINLYPFSFWAEVGCMRMEIYGCPVSTESAGGCVRVGSDILAKVVTENPVYYLLGSVTAVDENRIVVKTETKSTMNVKKSDQFGMALDKDIDKTIQIGQKAFARYKSEPKFYSAEVKIVKKLWVYVKYDGIGSTDWVAWENLRPYNEAHLCDCPPCNVGFGLKKACNQTISPYDFGVVLGSVIPGSKTIKGSVNKIVYLKNPPTTLTLNQQNSFIYKRNSCGCPQIMPGKTYLIFGKESNGEMIIDWNSLVKEWPGSNAKLSKNVAKRCTK